jgi:hypothetical protein
MFRGDATALLQRFGRSMMMRRAFGKRFAGKIKVAKMVRRLRFAKRVQAYTRGYLVRKNFVAEIMAERLRPILAVQRFCRGLNARRALGRYKRERRAIRDRASELVVRFAKARRSRKKTAVYVCRAALKLLERAGRGYLMRRLFLRRVLRMRHARRDAQWLIGRVASGYRERKRLRRRQCKAVSRDRRMFLFQVARFVAGYRARKALAMRNALVLRARRTTLAGLVQRVGQGYFERRFQAFMRRRAISMTWLASCARLIQGCGRGLVARRSVPQRCVELRDWRQRQKVRRRAMRGVAATLQRIGRGFVKRRRCFRRLYRQQRVITVLLAAAHGFRARKALAALLYIAKVDRAKLAHAVGAGDDRATLRALVEQNKDLKEQLAEEHFRFDSLVADMAGEKRGKLGDPVAKLLKAIDALLGANAKLRAAQRKVPAEVLASRINAVQRLDERRTVLVTDNAKLDRTMAARAGKVAAFDLIAGELRLAQEKHDKEMASIARFHAVQAAKAARAREEERRAEASIAAIEAKQLVAEQFEEEGRACGSPTASLRRRGTSRLSVPGRSLSPAISFEFGDMAPSMSMPAALRMSRSISEPAPNRASGLMRRNTMKKADLRGSKGAPSTRVGVCVPMASPKNRASPSS